MIVLFCSMQYTKLSKIWMKRNKHLFNTSPAEPVYLFKSFHIELSSSIFSKIKFALLAYQ